MTSIVPKRLITVLTETMLVLGMSFVNREEAVRMTMLTGGEKGGERMDIVQEELVK